MHRAPQQLTLPHVYSIPGPGLCAMLQGILCDYAKVQ